jgi:hypothetical protein
MQKLSCFKAYDVRGRVPGELNEDLAYRIGRAYAAFLSPVRVAVGRDIRFSSLPLTEALAAGLNDAGVEVWVGLCGTEQVYFATSHLRLGGIMVTASHNPRIQRYEIRPGRSRHRAATGLKEIECLAARSSAAWAAGTASVDCLRPISPSVELHRPPGLKPSRWWSTPAMAAPDWC